MHQPLLCSFPKGRSGLQASSLPGCTALAGLAGCHVLRVALHFSAGLRSAVAAQTLCTCMLQHPLTCCRRLTTSCCL